MYLRIKCSEIISCIYCFIIGISYVLFLYIGADLSLGRDHPKTIKSRFIRVFAVCLFSIFLFRFICCVPDELGDPLWVLLGFKLQGLIASVIIPLILSMILFLGPLLQSYYNTHLQFVLSPKYWSQCFSSLIWLRTIIVGPWTEEIVYRACMIPVLANNFGNKAILLSPLFFGLAHLHHAHTSIKEGVPIKKALLRSSFQFSFTTVFGVLSAFLFVRTGNIISSITCHMFCNFMGFPDFGDLMYNPDNRYKIMSAYVLGLVSFIFFVQPLTSKALYQYI